MSLTEMLVTVAEYAREGTPICLSRRLNSLCISYITRSLYATLCPRKARKWRFEYIRGVPKVIRDPLEA